MVYLFLPVRYLVQFLSLLSEQQSVNRMTPSNIAIVLGPNLLWPRAEGCVVTESSLLCLPGSAVTMFHSRPSPPLCLFREAALFDMASASSVQVVTVIEPLIQHSSTLFPEGIRAPNTDVPP